MSSPVQFTSISIPPSPYLRQPPLTPLPGLSDAPTPPRLRAKPFLHLPYLRSLLWQAHARPIRVPYQHLTDPIHVTEAAVPDHCS